MKKSGSMVVAVLASLLLAAPMAHGSEGYATWLKRMPITFSGYTPPGGGAALTNFPALVVLSNTVAGAGFNYNDFLAPPYGDLRFTADDKETPLDFEVESWNVGGVSHVWVKVPELTAATTIHALWGKAGVAVPACTTNGAVWNGRFSGVWHMAQTNSLDSSGNGRHATVAGGSVAAVAGVVGAADRFSAGYITAPSPVNTAGGTISLWFRSDSVAAGQKAIFATGNTVYDSGPHTLLVRSGASLNSYSPPSYSVITNIAAQKWYHVTLVRETGWEYAYINGIYTASRTWSNVGNNQNLYIGSGYQANFQGDIDEFRVTEQKRSAAWIWAEYRNMASNGLFNVYGKAELQFLPVVAADGVSDVTASGARLLGNISSTGMSATVVSAYWGRSNGGDNAAAWETQAVVEVSQSNAAFSIYVTGLSPNTNYYARFAASNEAGVVWTKQTLNFITGDVWLEKLSDASESGLVPGTVMVHRAEGAVAEPLEVDYTIDGTATPGEDYVALSGKAVIPAGETNAVIEIVPLFDYWSEGLEEVVLTLLPGPYVLDDGDTASVGIGDFGQVTCVWSGGGTNGLASNPTNWVDGIIPQNGAAVVLDATSAKGMFWDMPVTLASWTQAAGYTGTVTVATRYGSSGFTNLVINGDCRLLGGVWTHPANPNGNTMVYRLRTVVMGDFVVGTGAVINVDGKGFDIMCGPGRGKMDGTGAGGAGYGGVGHTGYVGGNAGPLYGSYDDAILPGSGGGGGGTYGGVGGNGGGAALLEASQLVEINGVITANGGNGTSRAGGGSGGGITIKCGVLTGTGGVVRANGGYAASSNGGDGGGGRIVVICSDAPGQLSAPKHRVIFDARPVTLQNANLGDVGAVYLSDPSLLDSAWLPHFGELFLPDWHGWQVAEVNISGWLRLAPSNANYFVLGVTGDMEITGAAARFELTGPDIEIGGDLRLTDGGRLYLTAIAAGESEVAGGAHGLMEVAGKLGIAAGSWLYPLSEPFSGSVVKIRAGSVEIADGGGINANGRGFRRGTNTSGFQVDGYGPGKAKAATANGSGAGYGGRGGRSEGTSTRGATYGDPLWPLQPGSGGAGRTGYAGVSGGNGGGLIWLEADGSAKVDGTLTACGAVGAHHGGGSGGAIFIACRRFDGGENALLTVDGGNGNGGAAGKNGGGGGGRIAVWYGDKYVEGMARFRWQESVLPPITYLGEVSAKEGDGYQSGTEYSEPGTINFIRVSSPPGTILMLR